MFEDMRPADRLAYVHYVQGQAPRVLPPRLTQQGRPDLQDRLRRTLPNICTAHILQAREDAHV